MTSAFMLYEPSTSDSRHGFEVTSTKSGKLGAQHVNVLRVAALREVDEATFSLFHIKVGLVASAGFFTDAYDIFAISIAVLMLGLVYGEDGSQSLSGHQQLGVKIATPIGTLIGQLIFGGFADYFGRKRMYGFELIVILIGTFAQAIAGLGTHINVIAFIIAWRVITGIGIGGDYPLSAIIASEFSSTKIRGRLMCAVFAAQGWGNFVATLVAFFIVLGYKNKFLGDPGSTTVDKEAVDQMWRLLIGLGCVPSAIALYFRLTIPESPRFTMDIEMKIREAAIDIENSLAQSNFTVDPDPVEEQVSAPKATVKDFIAYFGKWRNMKILIGTAYSWFAIDTAFYGVNLNTPNILQAIHLNASLLTPTLTTSTSSTPLLSNETIFEGLKSACLGNLILAGAGLIPGYYVTFFLIDRWGRKSIQLMGFAMLTILFACLGFGYNSLTTKGVKAENTFIFLFCLSNFFQNFGPNTTTFIIPGEVFPTRYRSTAHGISAACGKLGAIISQVGFASINNRNGQPEIDHIFEIFALFTLTGIFSTLLLPETKNMTLEDLSNEDQENFLRGVRKPSANDSRAALHEFRL